MGLDNENLRLFKIPFMKEKKICFDATRIEQAKALKPKFDSEENLIGGFGGKYLLKFEFETQTWKKMLSFLFHSKSYYALMIITSSESHQLDIEHSQSVAVLNILIRLQMKLPKKKKQTKQFLH